MARRSDSDIKFITKLVSDCITFNLRPNEALSYIKQESGFDITYGTYFSYRTRLRGEKKTNSWLSYYTRIGFVTEHKELLDNIKKVQEDRLRQFFIETLRPVRNERVISLLNHDILDNSRLISDLMDATPIIASLKARMRVSDEGTDKEGRLNALRSRVEIWKQAHGEDSIGQDVNRKMLTTQDATITVADAERQEAENVQPDAEGVSRPAGSTREGAAGEVQRQTEPEPARKRDLWTV